MASDIQLRFVRYDREFLAKSWEWLNDMETKVLTRTIDFTKKQQEAFYESIPMRADYLIWGITLAGEPIGACGLKHVTAVDAEYWGYIGEKRYWGKGLGWQLIKHCENVAYSLKLKSLYLHVGMDNVRAKKLYTRCGFVVDESESAAEVVMRKMI